MSDIGEINTGQFEVLSLKQIAWWWLPESMSKAVTPEQKKIWADLPTIQRGFVWNALQIERLWDSIVRKFPVGSIMLQRTSQPHTSDKKKFCGEQGDIPHGIEHYYHILDGQQRATSIALGFKNYWSCTRETTQEPKDWRSLWVDIGESGYEDCAHSFRVTSKAHPWGYARKHADGKNPARISAEDMRSALRAYNCIRRCKEQRHEEYQNMKPYEVPPDIAFPWDSIAPVPVALILECLMEKDSNISITNIAVELLKKMERLPQWRLMERDGTCDLDGVKLARGIAPEAIKIAARKFERVREILCQPTSNDGRVFGQIVMGLVGAVSRIEVPGPVLDINRLNHSQECAWKGDNEGDSAFRMFERINTSGTALTVEEINYSMLKAAWEGAGNVIDGLLEDRHLTHPARLVSLLSRLILTFHPRPGTSVGHGEGSGLRARLSISQFRRELGGASDRNAGEDASEQERGRCLRDELQGFCEEGGENRPSQAKILLDTVWSLLTEGEWGLPPILAADITRHGEDLVLLIMGWLHRLGTANIAYSETTEEVRKRVLGFVTAMHWLARDLGVCANVLGKELVTCAEAELQDFFNRERFRRVLDIRNRDAYQMPDILTVEDFKDALESPLPLSAPLEDNVEGVWGIGDLWRLYGEGASTQSGEGQEGGNRSFRIIDSLYRDRRWVLFAQRRQIKKWYAYFDPTKVDRITDHNVPWDFDHILPRSWVGVERISSYVPKLCRLWVHSNGNMRAWPAEHNRAKGNHRLIEESMVEYGLSCGGAVEEASFIKTREGWRTLFEVGSGKEFWERLDKGETKLWYDFNKAAVMRTVDIYREWFEELRVADLVG